MKFNIKIELEENQQGHLCDIYKTQETLVSPGT
jgi:hypothetical protein